eukprot:jgi/Chlat1/8087/Chrsp75S07585
MQAIGAGLVVAGAGLGYLSTRVGTSSRPPRPQPLPPPLPSLNGDTHTNNTTTDPIDNRQVNLSPAATDALDFAQPLSFVVFGASGDLARKKLYPALAALLGERKIPTHVNVVSGWFRAFRFHGRGVPVEASGGREGERGREEELLREFGPGNRVYFLSVPPTIFATVCSLIKRHAESPTGFTRLIIEKPEDQLFRIDHYLGKEASACIHAYKHLSQPHKIHNSTVVLNLTTLRFCNTIFEPVWDRRHVASVQLTFKEDIGTGGRGGYFDQFGIIRDIMQNHLLQVLMFLAMEQPKSLSREDIMKEKVKLLRCMKTLTLDDVILGQFTARSFKKFGDSRVEPGYLDDPTVPAGSRCPTFAMLRLSIDNDRWRGVPFLMTAGKGLDERMAEVRITFKPKGNSVAIYYRVMNKKPGFDQVATPAVLDLSYQSTYQGIRVADAYERMFLNAAKGDGSLFAWRMFTPMLHAIDKQRPLPTPYPFGSRGPAGMNAFALKCGVRLSTSWEEFLGTHAEQAEKLQALFEEIRELMRRFYDGRPPPEDKIQKVLERLDENMDGSVSWEEFKKGTPLLVDWSATTAVTPTA